MKLKEIMQRNWIAEFIADSHDGALHASGYATASGALPAGAPGAGPPVFMGADSSRVPAAHRLL